MPILPLGWHIVLPTLALDWGPLYEITSNKDKDLLIS